MAVPKIIPYDVELRSVNPVRSFDRPKAYTNDLKSVEFQFKILDMTSIELNTATAITLVYMRDGSFFANPSTDVERVGNVFSYLLKENEGNHAGVAQIQLVVTIDDAEFASQLFDFEIINGLETKVAQEVMIYDWTTLTRDARAYIDQFVADEVFRDAQFDNAQFDRNVAFVGSQESRALAFGVEQTNRGTAFTAEQNERTAEFNESESGRTTAETGRVTAEDGRVEAETDRVMEEDKRVTAESNRVTAEGNRVTAETGRVTAESGRVTAETNRAAAFTAFNTRLTAEETATANNKISSVKGKTFADVDARLEDVEFDTTLMATNLVSNGDFSNGTTGWSNDGSVLSAASNTLSATGSGISGNPGAMQNIGTLVPGNIYYLRAKVRVTNTLATSILFRLFFSAGTAVSVGTILAPVQSQWYTLNTIFTPTDQSGAFTMICRSSYPNAETATGKVLEVQYAEAFNLTATFGKGNEPTAEQMDEIMSKFTNSWFDGTKNLFRANATLNKLMAVDARTEFEMRNFILNSNFSSGEANWALAGFVDMGSYISTTDYRIYQTTGVDTGELTDKIYVRARAKLRDAGGNLTLVFTGSTFATVYGVALDTWYDLSGISTSRTSRVLQIAGSSVSSKIDVWKSIIAINLTKAFGAGKEPTLAEMDRLMARFPNSWFDGVKPIQTIETLYQEKANKVQEAWITPTLLNGWTNYGTDVLKMYKDEFGIVHIRGRIRGGLALTIIMTLPVGYRPAQGKYAANVASIGAAVTATKKLFMIAAQSGTDNRLFIFDGAAADWSHAESFLAIDISYRAEG